MSLRLVLGVWLLAATLAAGACASVAPPEIPTLEALKVVDGDGPGAVAIGWKDGSLVHVESAGMAEVEQGAPMKPDSVLRIASLTKQFTAVAVLALVDAGTLALDDALGERLAASPAHWRAITLRQLLSHTSGLTADMTPILSRLNYDFTPDELIEAFTTEPLASPPGSKWRYSNLNYWILGKVIEEASQSSYRDFVSAHVLAPAGLIRTEYGDFSRMIPGRARGYVRTADGALENAPSFSSSIGYAAGGFVSTPIEMARWYDALARGRIISPGLLKEALTPQQLSSGKRTPYGLGWYIETREGRLVAAHGGTSIGFGAFAVWRPDDGAFAAVFSNDGSKGEPEGAARAIFDAMTAEPRAGGGAD